MPIKSDVVVLVAQLEDETSDTVLGFLLIKYLYVPARVDQSEEENLRSLQPEDIAKAYGAASQIPNNNYKQ